MIKRIGLAFVSASALVLGACSGVDENGEVTANSIVQALADPTQVMGLESLSDWSVSAGIKSSTTDRTQGAAALAIKSFTYTDVISAPLGALSGVSANLKLDVKPPTSLAWGQVQIFVSAPSVGCMNVASNGVSLAGLPATYSTLSFTLPANAVTCLQSNATDKTFKIAITMPQSSSDFKLDNLRFQGGVINSLIELRVTNVDDWLHITVDGVRRKVSYIGDPTQGVKQDVSGWFGGGNNSFRIQNLNTGGPTNYRVELWVDGQLVLDDSAPAGVTTEGIAVDKTVTINTPNRPAFQTVTVTGSPSGKLYIDDVYTGSSTPATLSLPQGSYKLGLGVSTDTPGSYTGSFYEQSITVGGTSQSVNLTSTAPLGLQKTNTVLVIPIQNTWNYTPAAGGADPANNGVLQASDIPLLAGQIEATRDQWFRPFSYSLATWQITVRQMVTDTPLKETSHDQFKLDDFINDAGLASLRQEYDRIVFYFSQYRADGSHVADHYGSVYASSRQDVGFTSEYARGRSATQPSPYVLHEFLHNHEFYNSDILHQYNGIWGLHGAGQHGYPYEGSTGETDFVKFLRHFMRGQVAELRDMRPDITWPSIPATADLYTGVFKTLRTYTGKP